MTNQPGSGVPSTPIEGGPDAAARYFRARPGLQRLLTASRDTYQRLSRVGGRAVVLEPSAEEIRAMRDFLGISPRVEDNRVSLALQSLDDHLRRTRFACGLAELLVACYGGELSTRVERRLREDAVWHAFTEPLTSLLAHDHARTWWQSGGSRHVRRLLRERCSQDETLSLGSAAMDLQTAVRHCLLALEALPVGRAEPELLPIFAYRVCGDPHAFDADTVAGHLLASALSFRFGDDPVAGDPLSLVGLKRDDVSSQVLAAGVLSPDGFPSLWPVSWPLLSLLQWDRARAYNDVAYIVENPSVFRELCLVGASNPAHHVTVVCPSGQPSGAALHLLDLIVEGGAELRYAGDFDAAGILIAAKLRERYGERLRPWFMDAANYRAAIERQVRNPGAQLLTSPERAQLERLRPAFPELVAALLEHGMKAYQECLIPEMRTSLRGV